MEILNFEILPKFYSKKMRDAAAAHLRHIASEQGDEALKPRDFAIAAYVEFLEDKSKRLRRASLIALGFLNAKEAMSQLQYICMAAPEPEIREAAKNVLVSFVSNLKSISNVDSSRMAIVLTSYFSLQF